MLGFSAFFARCFDNRGRAKCEACNSEATTGHHLVKTSSLFRCGFSPRSIWIRCVTPIGARQAQALLKRLNSRSVPNAEAEIIASRQRKGWTSRPVDRSVRRDRFTGASFRLGSHQLGPKAFWSFLHVACDLDLRPHMSPHRVGLHPTFLFGGRRSGGDRLPPPPAEPEIGCGSMEPSGADAPPEVAEAQGAALTQGGRCHGPTAAGF